jgi:hypothetical protein
VISRTLENNLTALFSESKTFTYDQIKVSQNLFSHRVFQCYNTFNVIYVKEENI